MRGAHAGAGPRKPGAWEQQVCKNVREGLVYGILVPGEKQEEARSQDKSEKKECREGRGTERSKCLRDSFIFLGSKCHAYRSHALCICWSINFLIWKNEIQWFLLLCPLLWKWGSHMNSILTLYKLSWGMGSYEKKIYPSEKILLLLLYYFLIQPKLCVGAAGTSYMHCFDLSIIYFHIGGSAFPGNLQFLAQGCFGRADAVSYWGLGICHVSPTCRFTFEGLKTIWRKGVGEEKSYFIFSPPTSESNYLIKIHHSFCPRSSVT